jgi:hypothetical protein
MATVRTLTYAAKAGVQAQTHFEHEPNDVLETSISGSSYELTGLTLTTIQTNEERVEVNSVT